jgi:hypothetical protein
MGGVVSSLPTCTERKSLTSSMDTGAPPPESPTTVVDKAPARGGDDRRASAAPYDPRSLDVRLLDKAPQGGAADGEGADGRRASVANPPKPVRTNADGRRSTISAFKKAFGRGADDPEPEPEPPIVPEPRKTCFTKCCESKKTADN